MEILETVPGTFLLLVAAFTLLYWYLTKNFSYWKSAGIPYAKPYPIVGSFGSFLVKPFHSEEEKRYKRYGRIYGGFEGGRPYLSVGDPVILKDIFVKDFKYFSDRRDLEAGNEVIDNMVSTLVGEDWKRVRNIITPVFTSGKLRKLYYIVDSSSTKLKEHFMAKARTGKPIDVSELFGAFTMDVIISTAFGTKIDSFNDPTNRLVDMGKQMFRQNWRFAVFWMFPTLVKLLHIGGFSTQSSAYFKEFILQVISERKHTGKRREDFLQMLLDIAEESNPEQEVPNKENEAPAKQKEGSKILSLNELVSQCVLFLAAGYDTTSTALSFIAYSLALNPECQEKLVKEIDAAYGKQETIDYEVIQNLHYLDGVISEALRMYPPVIRGERKCVQDYKHDLLGVTVPRNMMLTIPFYGMHYDPEFYPDPKRFRPDRFLPENKSNIVPYTYLPFGFGPRNCVGMRFAMMEMKICLVHLMRHFRFKSCEQTEVPLNFNPGNLLMSPKTITLRVEIRNDVPEE